MGLALPMLAMGTEMKTRWPMHGGTGFTRVELVVVICVLAVVVMVLLPGLVPQQHALPLRSTINCVNNLKQVGLAFRIWEGDNGGKFPMHISVTNGGAMELASAGDVAGIFRTLSNELSTPKVLICPKDTERVVTNNFARGFSSVNLSYFVGLDADDKYPQMILSGDDNFAVDGIPVKPGLLKTSTNSPVAWASGRHVSYNAHFWTPARYRWAGNIALADGSVQTTTALSFQSTLVNTGFATNRFLIP